MSKQDMSCQSIQQEQALHHGSAGGAKHVHSRWHYLASDAGCCSAGLAIKKPVAVLHSDVSGVEGRLEPRSVFDGGAACGMAGRRSV